jgi:hypothetical protein
MQKIRPLSSDRTLTEGRLVMNRGAGPDFPNTSERSSGAVPLLTYSTRAAKVSSSRFESAASREAASIQRCVAAITCSGASPASAGERATRSVVSLSETPVRVSETPGREPRSALHQPDGHGPLTGSEGSRAAERRGFEPIGSRFHSTESYRSRSHRRGEDAQREQAGRLLSSVVVFAPKLSAIVTEKSPRLRRPWNGSPALVHWSPLRLFRAKTKEPANIAGSRIMDRMRICYCALSIRSRAARAASAEK